MNKFLNYNENVLNKNKRRVELNIDSIRSSCFNRGFNISHIKNDDVDILDVPKKIITDYYNFNEYKILNNQPNRFEKFTNTDYISPLYNLINPIYLNITKYINDYHELIHLKNFIENSPRTYLYEIYNNSNENNVFNEIPLITLYFQYEFIYDFLFGKLKSTDYHIPFDINYYNSNIIPDFNITDYIQNIISVKNPSSSFSDLITDTWTDYFENQFKPEFDEFVKGIFFNYNHKKMIKSIIDESSKYIIDQIILNDTSTVYNSEYNFIKETNIYNAVKQFYIENQQVKTENILKFINLYSDNSKSFLNIHILGFNLIYDDFYQYLKDNHITQEFVQDCIANINTSDNIISELNNINLNQLIIDNNIDVLIYKQNFGNMLYKLYFHNDDFYLNFVKHFIEPLITNLDSRHLFVKDILFKNTKKIFFFIMTELLYQVTNNTNLNFITDFRNHISTVSQYEFTTDDYSDLKWEYSNNGFLKWSDDLINIFSMSFVDIINETFLDEYRIPR